MFNPLRAKEAIIATTTVTTPVTTVTEGMTLDQVLTAMLQWMKEENAHRYRMGRAASPRERASRWRCATKRARRCWTSRASRWSK
jgi:hypothetical protein